FFFQAEDGIRDRNVTGVQTCALPILARYLGARVSAPGGDAPALHVSNTLLPQALAGGQRQVPSLESLEQFRRRLGIPESAGAKRSEERRVGKECRYR